jgi:membrane protease YdiL (CAAX protease family)
MKKSASKKFLFPFILFLLSNGFGVILYMLLDAHVEKEFLQIGFRLFLAITFLTYTILYVKNKAGLFKFSKITRRQLSLSTVLIVAFAINNYFHSIYSKEVEYMHNSGISLVLIGFVVNSFFEEFAYRGFIQNYINERSSLVKSPISQGNIFASILMLVSHFGFFTVMDTVFATTGLILVLLFSLIAGYLRDLGASIWYLIILHTLVNMVHLLINLEHYL